MYIGITLVPRVGLFSSAQHVTILAIYFRAKHRAAVPSPGNPR